MTRWPGGRLFPAGVSLETERLRLRIAEERDLDALARIYADKETMRYIGEGKPLSREDTWRAISNMLGHWMLRGYGMWMAERRDTGEMIGRVGFLDPVGWPGFELGWIFSREHWGNGFATEGARAALAYATDKLGKERVISLIRPHNTASMRVAEKIGFTRGEELDLMGGPVLVYANRHPR